MWCDVMWCIMWCIICKTVWTWVINNDNIITSSCKTVSVLENWSTNVDKRCRQTTLPHQPTRPVSFGQCPTTETTMASTILPFLTTHHTTAQNTTQTQTHDTPVKPHSRTTYQELYWILCHFSVWQTSYHGCSIHLQPVMLTRTNTDTTQNSLSHTHPQSFWFQIKRAYKTDTKKLACLKVCFQVCVVIGTV